MRYFVIILGVVAVFVIGCSKPSPSSKGGGGSTSGGVFAFSGYQYEGFMTQLSREWEKPVLVQFNSDSTVTDYCFFYLNVGGNWLSTDSLTGKILSVGTGSGGGPTVTVYFKATADTQVYSFSPDLSGLNGGSNGLASNQFYFQALTKITKPAASLAGSFWTSDTSHEQNSTEGSPWYPDINGVQFNSDGFTSYFRNGAVCTLGLIPHDTTVIIKYWQYGNRVYFYGFNEEFSVGVPYWGVISDDGNTINADTEDFSYARVPNYDQTFDYYGEAGNPPVMHRKLN